MSDSIVTITPVYIPVDTTPQVREIVLHLEHQLQTLATELNRLTQGLYEKNSTQPYFLPPGGVVGYKLYYVTRTDAQGRTFHSAEWAP